MSGMICAGNVLLNLLTPTGEGTGFLPAVNCIQAEIAAKGADKKERISKMRDTYGQVLDLMSTPNPHELTMEFDDAAAHILALAFSGGYATHAQGSGTVTAEVVVARKGKLVDLQFENVSAVVVTDSAGTTTYVTGTDYSVEAKTGMLLILADGAMTEGQTLHVNYVYSAVSGQRISGATKSQIDVEMKIDGINKANGKRVLVHVPHAILNSDSGVDFLADDFVKIKLSGTIKTVEGSVTPYTVVVYD